MSDEPNRRLRLGQGRLTGDLATLWKARSAFLRAVALVEPDTYATLALSDYGDVPDGIGVVRYWQAKFNLRDDWLAEVAVRTFRRDYAIRRAGKVLWESRPAHPFVIPRQASTPWARGVFDLPLVEKFWNPYEETRAEVRARILALVDAELDRIEAEAAEPKTVTKSADHFVWLARYQVLEHDADTIAGELETDADIECGTDKARGVRDGLKRTAALIGLTYPLDEHVRLPLFGD